MCKNSDSLGTPPIAASAVKNGSTSRPEVLTGEEFINAVRQGVVRDWNGYQISGDVDLTGETIEKPLKIQGAVFTGTVNLSQVRFERGVDFAGSRFQKLILSDTRVEGPLTLNNVVIGVETAYAPDVKMIRQTVAEFDNVRIAGCVSMMKAIVFGGLSCNYAEIEDDFSIDGAEIYGNLSLRHTSLGELRTDKNLDAGGAEDQPCRVHGTLDLTSASITGDVRLVGIVIGGELLGQAAKIDGNLLCRVKKNTRCEVTKRAWMLGITVIGNVDISGAHIGGDLIMQNANIGQNFLGRILGGFQSQIDGNTYLNGVRIRGAAELAGVLLRGELNLDGASIDGGFIAAFDVDDEADWQIIQSRVGGRIHGTAATISNRVMLMGLTVGPIDGAVGDSTVKQRGVHFPGAHIKGEFSLYSENLVSEIVQSKIAGYRAREISPEVERAVFHQARQEQTLIQGDLRLTRAQVSGDICLSGVTIEGELDLRDAIVRANINCKPIEFGPGESPLRASVYRADLETLDMTGDINLTGLTINGRPPAGSDGDLILRAARIRGRLELYPAMDDGDPLMDDPHYTNKITYIHDDLRINAAEISHVIISRKNFREIEEKATEKQVRVGMERATIGRLQIIKPLPGRLDLSNLKVNRLDSLEDPSIYQNMVTNSYPFRKSNYLAIEHQLRNAGYNAEADKVHVLMRRHDRPPLRSFPRWLLDVFLHLTIKYGTTSVPLIIIMLLWFGVSVWIFSDRNRVVYDAPQPDKPQMSIPPESWSRGDSALFAVRLHVPIISLGVEEKAKPKGTGWKAYAMTVVALSWVMWPLLIASASGLIRKRE